MEPFDYIKALVLNFRLYNCCWCAPVRIGLILAGYFNAILAAICVVGTANGSLVTTLIQVQTKIMEDYVTSSVVMFAYITEVAFSVVCLCGIYRKDLVLLRVYMYYCVAALVMSILVYSIVILAIDVVLQLTIICGILYQSYVLLLVRSAIVEIKWEKKQTELPTLVLSSLIHDKEPLKDQLSIKSQDSKHDDEKNELQEGLEAITDAHEARVDMESPEPELEKNGKKDEKAGKKDDKTGKKDEIKLETVNEEISPVGP